MADDEGGADVVAETGEAQQAPREEVKKEPSREKPKGDAAKKDKKLDSAKSKKSDKAGKTESEDEKKPRAHEKCTAPEQYEKPPVKMPPKPKKPWKVKKQPCCHDFCNPPKSDPANYPKGYPWSGGKLKCLPGYCQDHKEASEEEKLARERAQEDAERIYRESVEKCRRKEQQQKIDEAADELKFFFRLLYLTNHPDLVPNFKKKLEKMKEEKKKGDSKQNVAGAGSKVDSKSSQKVTKTPSKTSSKPGEAEAAAPPPAAAAVPVEEPAPVEPAAETVAEPATEEPAPAEPAPPEPAPVETTADEAPAAEPPAQEEQQPQPAEEQPPPAAEAGTEPEQR